MSGKKIEATRQNPTWGISSIHILDKNNSLVIKKTFIDIDFEVQYKILPDYLNALKNFTTDILDSPLQEVVFEDKRIIFSSGEDFSIIVVLFVSPAVETGPGSQVYRILNIFIRNVEKWVRKFFENNRQNNYLNYIDNLVDQLSTKIHSMDEELFMYKGDETEFDLMYSFILNQFGQPIFTKQHSDELHVDPFLIFTFLAAINNFSSTYLNFQLQHMVLGNYRFFFNQIDGKLYGLVVKLEKKCTVSSEAPAMKKTENFLNELTESLEYCFDDEDFDENLIETMLDSLIQNY